MRTVDILNKLLNVFTIKGTPQVCVQTNRITLHFNTFYKTKDSDEEKLERNVLVLELTENKVTCVKTNMTNLNTSNTKAYEVVLSMQGETVTDIEEYIVEEDRAVNRILDDVNAVDKNAKTNMSPSFFENTKDLILICNQAL